MALNSGQSLHRFLEEKESDMWFYHPGNTTEIAYTINDVLWKIGIKMVFILAIRKRMP